MAKRRKSTKAELEKYRDAARAVKQGIARGEDAVDEGHTVSHADAKRHMSRWLK